MMRLTVIQIIELTASIALFAFCFAGYIHTRGIIANANLGEAADDASERIFKKKKKRKTLFFVGMVFSIWFLLGFIITLISQRKGGLKIEFEMFSPRVEVFGISIAETTLISLAVVAVLAVLCVLFRLIAVPKFKNEPSGIQNAAEICVEFVDNLTANAVGAKAAATLSPYMFSIALYMIGCASVELLGLRAPTSDLTVTIALGLMTFILLNAYGFKKLGFGGRLKSMGGPVAPMRLLMIPLKMVSDIAVPISLGCRLFGNMLGGLIVMDLLKGALGGYAAGIPGIAGLYFNLFHPLIQAYIFITLSLTFINEAMEPVEEPDKKPKAKNKKSA